MSHDPPAADQSDSQATGLFTRKQVYAAQRSRCSCNGSRLGRLLEKLSSILFHLHIVISQSLKSHNFMPAVPLGLLMCSPTNVCF